jgi:NAD(P)H-quinone oxidoreductase subunit 4
MGLYGSNEPGLDLDSLINPSYPATLEIFFIFRLPYCLCCEIADYTPTYVVTHGESWISSRLGQLTQLI